MKTLYWVRNDLRLHDNMALLKARSVAADDLSIVYSFTKSDLGAATFRRGFLQSTLRAFDISLRKFDQRLHITTDPIGVVLSKNSSIRRVVYTKSYNSRDRVYESALATKAQETDVEVIPVDQSPLYLLEQLPVSIDKLKSFTPFRKSIEGVIEPSPPMQAPVSLPAESTPLVFAKAHLWEQPSAHSLFSPGESAGLDRVQRYLWDTKAVSEYKETRNGMIRFDDSSKFSPYLALGSLSPRWIYHELKRYEDEIESNESTYWLYFELLWRDFFKFYALKHGEAIFRLTGPKDRQLDWEPVSRLKSHWKKWTRGTTNQDFVDANMRELLNSGWMSNRGRQNVASYWAKHIFCDWRLGAKWFERNLIDFDVESNWGNWAYNSGVGPDPRDRKFDLERQAQMYDPDRIYRKMHLE